METKMPRAITVLCLLLCLLPATKAHSAKLKIATLSPDGTVWMKLMRKAGETIKQETEGRVKLRFYPGGVMGNDKSVMRKIRVGQLHGGTLTGGSLSLLNPDATVYSTPFLFRNLNEVDQVRSKLDQLIIDGVRKKGFVSYGLSEGGFGYLMSNHPVSSTRDLKQLKIWIPEGDRLSERLFRGLGITPIPLPITDVLTGLQTGLIDTIAASAVGAVALQWHTRIKYLTHTPIIYLYGTLVISEKALKRLTPEDRAIVHRELSRTFDTLNRQSREDEQGALEALRNQGIEFIDPAPEDRRGWEAHARKTIRKVNGEVGPPRELLLQVDQIINNHRNTK
jgi:TRAP-type C4-dicarboxylate transport system substrate-binding protein